MPTMMASATFTASTTAGEEITPSALGLPSRPPSSIGSRWSSACLSSFSLPDLSAEQ